MYLNCFIFVLVLTLYSISLGVPMLFRPCKGLWSSDLFIIWFWISKHFYEQQNVDIHSKLFANTVWKFLHTISRRPPFLVNTQWYTQRVHFWHSLHFFAKHHFGFNETPRHDRYASELIVISIHNIIAALYCATYNCPEINRPCISQWSMVMVSGGGCACQAARMEMWQSDIICFALYYRNQKTCLFSNDNTIADMALVQSYDIQMQYCYFAVENYNGARLSRIHTYISGEQNIFSSLQSLLSSVLPWKMT